MIEIKCISTEWIKSKCLRKSRGLGKAGIAAQDAGRLGYHHPLPNLRRRRGGGTWPKSIFFKIRFKIKWLEKELDGILIKTLIKIKSLKQKYADQKKALIKKKCG